MKRLVSLILIVTLVFLILPTNQAHAAISVNMRNTGTTFTNTVAPTFTATVNAGSNTILIVYSDVLRSSSNQPVIKGVKWDTAGANESLHLLVSKIYTGGSDGLRGEIWYLINPTPGVGKTIEVTYDRGAYGEIAASAYDGVDPASPWDTVSVATSQGTNTTPSLSSTTVNGEMVLNLLGTEQTGTATTDASQTQIFNSTDGNSRGVASDEVATGVSTSMDYTTTSGNNVWVMLNVALRPTSTRTFSYYSPVTVNSAQVPSAQVNFPMLVSYTDARLKSTGNGGHVQNANGYDIRPYSDSGLTTPLSYELERYNASTGEVIMWVRIPSIDVGSVVYLAYGDSTISTNDSSPSTWDKDYKAVYHFPDGTTVSANDSTVTRYNLVNTGAVTADTGQIDGAGGVDNTAGGGPTYYEGDDYFPMTGADVTISFWAKRTSNQSFSWVIGKGLSNNTGFQDWSATFNNTAASIYLIRNGANVSPSTAVIGSSFTYFVGTMNASASKMYFNNTLDSTQGGISGADTGNSGTYVFGIGWTGNQGFVGSVDEVRVSNSIRSADWGTTEYNNQSAPSTFATLGTEVSVGGTPAVTNVIANIAVKMNINGNANIL